MSSPTNPPSEHDLTRYVIDRLAGYTTFENVVLDICRVMEWEWDRSALFVKAVREKYARRIALAQSPLFFTIAFGILIVGLVLTGATGYLFWSTYQVHALADLSVLARASRLVYGFFAGLCMIVGSVGGMWVFIYQVIRGR